MITRGASDPASAPNSPSSRAGTAPSDSEPPAATAVVDVTGGDEPWTTTSARRTAEPTPLAPSKRPPAKTVVGAAAPGKGKGKKRLVRRPAAGSAAANKDLTGGGHESDSSLEDKPAPPPTQEEQRAPIDADMAGQLRELQLEVQRLRSMVASQSTARVPRAAVFPAAPAPLTPTAPNAAGEMPPAEVRYLTSASFPEGAKKANGDYNPPQAHLLAASRMFRTFGTEAGTALSAMSFVLVMRELPSAKFQVNPAVLMAIFSGRLGSRGLTIMHFKEASEMTALEDGSTNANFASDF
ncbi:hypothetical protein BBJ28_00024498, partial [Nothophytophthora sp. Chile5]